MKKTIVLTEPNLPTTCTVDFTSGYTLTMETDGGEITGASNIVVGRTGETTLSYTISPGYNGEEASITCDSATATLDKTNKTIKISNVKLSQKCKLTIPKQVYTIKVTSNNTSYGTITNGEQTAYYGDTVTVTLNPSTNYKYSNNTCGGSVTDNILTISNIVDNKECTVIFGIPRPLASVINTSGATERTDFSDVETTIKLWKTTDYNASGNFSGTSYYYTGNPDNWVSFAGKLWRIVRINGDGSVRLLYSGIGKYEGYLTPADITNASEVGMDESGEVAYNENSNDPMYFGWKYGTSGSIANNRTNENKSNIYKVVESWYQKNILAQGLEKYISKTAIYCNDRTISGDYSSFTGAGELRIWKPSLECSNSADRFNEGFGIMSSDEVVFAGGSWAKSTLNSYFVLDSTGSGVNGTNWWTSTPFRFYDSICVVTVVSFSGGITTRTPTDSIRVRPVVSLNSQAKFIEGDGTSSNPYKIITE